MGEEIIKQAVGPEKPKNNSPQTNNLLCALLNHCTEAVILIDHEGLIKYHNQVLMHITGYSAEALKNKTVFEYLHPDDLDAALIFLNKAVLSPGETKEGELRIKQGDGNYLWVNCVVKNLLHEKGIEGFLLSIKNLSDQKLKDEKIENTNRELRRLFNTVREILFTVDMVNYQVVEMSSSSIEIYGYSPADFKADANLWRKAIHPDDMEIMGRQLQDLAKGLVVENEYRVIHKNGSIKWLANSVYPTLDEHGRLVRLDGISTDITEKKEVEARLNSNVNLLREFFESAPESILIRDADTGKFVDCNGNAIRMFGYTRNELLQLRPDQLAPEFQPDGIATSEKVKMLTQRAMQGEKVVSDWVHRNKKGCFLNNELRLTRLNLPGRNLLRVSIASIEEKKKAEEALKKSEANLKTIVQNTSVFYVILNDEFKVVSYNAVAVNWVKWILNEDIKEGQRYTQLLSEPYRTEIENACERALHGETLELEKVFNIIGGGEIWLKLRLEKIKDENDKPLGILVSGWDISEAKRAQQEITASEKKYRSLFENMNEGIASCELIYENGKPVDFRYIDVNPRFYEIMGWENVIGKKVSEVIPGILQTEPHIFQRYDRVIKSGKTESDESYLASINMWVALSVYHLHDNFFVIVFERIDERKRAEAEIQNLAELLERKVEQRTAELAEANKELEAFSYTVSHDLQAPLRTVNAFANVVREDYYDKLDDEGKEYLSLITSGTRKMSTLITELLGFARLGKTPLKKQMVDMNGLVTVATAEVKLNYEELKAEIVCSDLPQANCDQALLKQVWINLIGNAIKYSRKKEHPVIEIGAENLNGVNTYYVKDNGAGFDMRYAAQLFNVFKRLHTDKEFEGTGIGLALVARIITRHGGKIWADAKVDEGATFYFTLG